MIVGILVGGRSSRMGGAPKGLLPAPDGTGSLVERLARVAHQAVPFARVLLVGEAAPYAHLGLPTLADAVTGAGPIGGLLALLEAGEPRIIALSCDLPYLEPALVERLLHHAPERAAVAPRLDGRWEPLCARYDAADSSAAVRAALSASERSLQRVFGRLGERAEELPLAPGEREQLRDWDRPEDMR